MSEPVRNKACTSVDMETFVRHVTADCAAAPLLCGIKPVLELLRDDPGRIDTVYVRKGLHGDAAAILDCCRAGKIRFHLCDPADLARILDKSGAGATAEGGRQGQVRHQGVIARLLDTPFTDLEELLHAASEAPLPLLLALDQVQDPGNVGTLARTLYALGGAGLIVPRHNSAFLGAGARRSAAGALEKLPVSRVVNLSRALDAASHAGFAVYGAACSEQSVNAFTAPLRLPAVLVLGSEERGLRPTIAKRCDALLHIPMLRAFDSLNVAQAGAILVAECLRRIQ